MTTQSLRIDDRSVVRGLTVIIALLASAHLVTQIIKYEFGLAGLYGLIDLFDMEKENNLPTFLSGVQLLACAAVLFVIARTCGTQASERSTARRWMVLSVVFLLLAADEMASLHELTMRPMRELLPSVTTGLLYWGWVIPGGLFVLAMVVAYARFVLALPAATRNRTLIGGALFVLGAIGVEMPEARHVEAHGLENLTYGIYVLVEETLEMAGILVFLSGMLIHLRTRVGPVTVSVAQADARPLNASEPGHSASPRPVPARPPREPRPRGPVTVGGFSG